MIHPDLFTYDDIPAFLETATAEGWISSEWELTFLLQNFPAGCFVMRESNQPIAFVTSMKYDKSGWIGNLIVNEAMRGRGIGTILMKKALGALRDAWAETVWLTASPAGRPVYERLGFIEADMIIRWRCKGAGGRSFRICEIAADEAIFMDCCGWGDKRNALLYASRERGDMIGSADGFMVIQDCGNFRQLGPWAYARDKNASLLLDMALRRIEKSREIVLDVPEKNTAAASLLRSRNFKPVGRTCLMYAGDRPDYNPDMIYALGSMGSMG